MGSALAGLTNRQRRRRQATREEIMIKDNIGNEVGEEYS
jgi:hypothetical protein